MRPRTSLVCATAGAVLLAGSLGLARFVELNTPGCSSAAAQRPISGSDDMGHSLRHRGMHGHPRLIVGASCNTVELVDPSRSTYVPDIANASAADRAQAQQLLDGVDGFCRTHSAQDLEATWLPGSSNPSKPTHLFNPDPTSGGLDPANPRAVLVYKGRLGGVMFTGRPLPRLGSIPRAHIHDLSMPVEMVHVYCTARLREAFTPNRTLGVMADVKALRLKIRPAVTDLDETQLYAVAAEVRGYAGHQVPAVTAGTPGSPVPVLQAIRAELRRSLMVLTEAQLRSVWSLMRSYPAVMSAAGPRAR